MRERDNTKVKGVSFNLDDPIEKFMYETVEELRKKRVSFSGLVKNLYFAYLLNTGQVPPGLSFVNTIGNIPVPETTNTKEQNAKEQNDIENDDKEGILNMPFSLDDDDDFDDIDEFD